MIEPNLEKLDPKYFTSYARDIGVIEINPNLPKEIRENIIVHELVHIFQHFTEEDNYFVGDSTNLLRYIKYLDQRIEVEAHYIQCLYIFYHSKEFLVSCLVEKNPNIVSELIDMIEEKILQPYSLDRAKKIILLFIMNGAIVSDTFPLPSTHIEPFEVFSITFTGEEYSLSIRDKFGKV